MMRTVSWAEIEAAAVDLANRWRGPGQPPTVHGVPRGGCVPAAIVAGHLDARVVDVPDPHTLVVDDLVDSGATWERFERTCRFDALFRKSHSPAGAAPAAHDVGDEWLVFPWELHDEDQGPTDAARRLIEFVGEDPSRPGLLDTPARMVKALAELTGGYQLDPAVVLDRLFDDTCDEMVVLSGIEFTSLCEHHILTFTGTATVAYIPDGMVVGLSKLARVVDVFARRLQVQERLTEQIANAIADHVPTRGVGVVIEARHSCMGCRGVRKPGAVMRTSKLTGLFKDDPRARAEFLSLVSRDSS